MPKVLVLFRLQHILQQTSSTTYFDPFWKQKYSEFCENKEDLNIVRLLLKVCLFSYGIKFSKERINIRDERKCSLIGCLGICKIVTLLQVSGMCMLLLDPNKAWKSKLEVESLVNS